MTSRKFMVSYYQSLTLARLINPKSATSLMKFQFSLLKIRSFKIDSHMIMTHLWNILVLVYAFGCHIIPFNFNYIDAHFLCDFMRLMRILLMLKQSDCYFWKISFLFFYHFDVEVYQQLFFFLTFINCFCFSNAYETGIQHVICSSGIKT